MSWDHYGNNDFTPDASGASAIETVLMLSLITLVAVASIHVAGKNAAAAVEKAASAMTAEQQAIAGSHGVGHRPGTPQPPYNYYSYP